MRRILPTARPTLMPRAPEDRPRALVRAGRASGAPKMIWESASDQPQKRKKKRTRNESGSSGLALTQRLSASSILACRSCCDKKALTPVVAIVLAEREEAESLGEARTESVSERFLSARIGRASIRRWSIDVRLLELLLCFDVRRRVRERADKWREQQKEPSSWPRARACPLHPSTLTRPVLPNDRRDASPENLGWAAQRVCGRARRPIPATARP